MLYFSGELTEKGFRIQQMILWLKYQEHQRKPLKNITSSLKPGSRHLQGIVGIPVIEMDKYGNMQEVVRRANTFQTFEEILHTGGRYTNEGHLPWEKKHVFGKFEKVRRYFCNTHKIRHTVSYSMWFPE